MNAFQLADRVAAAFIRLGERPALSASDLWNQLRRIAALDPELVEELVRRPEDWPMARAMAANAVQTHDIGRIILLDVSTGKTPTTIEDLRNL